MMPRDFMAWQVCARDGDRRKCDLPTPCEGCFFLADRRLSAIAAAGYKILSREPAEEMVAKADATCKHVDRYVALDVWPVMWDAAP